MSGQVGFNSPNSYFHLPLGHEVLPEVETGLCWTQRCVASCLKACSQGNEFSNRVLSKEEIRAFAKSDRNLDQFVALAIQDVSAEITKGKKSLSSDSDSLVDFLGQLRDSEVSDEAIQEKYQKLTEPLRDILENRAAPLFAKNEIQGSPRHLLEILDAEGNNGIESLLEDLNQVKDLNVVSKRQKTFHRVDNSALQQNLSNLEALMYEELCLKAEGSFQNMGGRASQIAKVNDPKLKVELLKRFARQSPSSVCEQIKDFRIEDPKARADLAKICASGDLEIFLESFDNFDIPEGRDKREVIEFCIQLESGKWGDGHTVRNFDYFNVANEKERAEYAKQLIAFQHYAVLTNISRFGIEDKKLKGEVLELSIVDKHAVNNFLANYQDLEITDSATILKLIRKCAEIDLTTLINYVPSLGISEGKVSFEVARICAGKDGELTLKNLDKFSLGSENFKRMVRSLCYLNMTNNSQFVIESFTRENLPLLLADLGPLGAERSMGPKVVEIPKDPKVLRDLLLLDLALSSYKLVSSEPMNSEVQGIFAGILKYRNASLCASLIQVFSGSLQEMDQQRQEKLLTDLQAAPKFFVLQSIYMGKWTGGNLENDSVQALYAFASKHRIKLKDAKNNITQLWLQTARALENSAEISREKKLSLMAQACASDNLEDIKKRLSILQSTCEVGLGVELNREFSPYMTQELTDLFVDSLKKDSYLNIQDIEGFTDKYLATLGNMRIPNAWRTYEIGLKSINDEKVKLEFQRFIRCVLNGTHAQERYKVDQNPHLKKIQECDPELFKNWQKSSETLLGKFKVVDTDNWQDLFLAGSEVLGSCQRVDGIPNINKCLLAYIMDGKNRMLAIKNEDGVILARCMFRILWDEKNSKPVLFQDPIYPVGCKPEYISQLNELALEKAKALQCPLLSRNPGVVNPYNGNAVSLGSCSPFDYSDTAERADDTAGVKAGGIFTIPLAGVIYSPV